MTEFASKFAINGFNAFYQQVRNEIGLNTVDGKTDTDFLDPICTCVKIGLLQFKPLDTKISINNNRINYQDPSWHQGVIRGWGGFIRDHLNHIELPILYFRGIQLGHIKPFLSGHTEMSNVKLSLDYIHLLMIKGFHKCLSTYERSRGDFSKVQRLIEGFITILTSKQSPEEFKKEVNKHSNAPTMFAIYNEFMKKWSEQDLNLIVQLCKVAETGTGEKYNNHLAKSIDHFLMAKDLDIDTLRPHLM